MAARTKRQAAGQAAISASRRRFGAEIGKPTQLSTGTWVIIRSVSPSLIADAQANIEDPDIPTYFNEDKGRTEENPNDPKYVREMERAQIRRGQAGMDALLLFGIDLVDGPEGNPVDLRDGGAWLKKLKFFLTKVAGYKLEDYDFDDPLTVEFLYKRYIAAGPNDISLIASASGISEEDIASAERSFLGNEERGPDLGARAD